MSRHTETLAKVLNRSLYAVRGESLYGSADFAAEVFETLLRYHGLTLVSTCGLVVSGDAYNSETLEVVQIDGDGLIRPPKLKKPYTPELAMRLGTALIAAATQAIDLGAGEVV
jgi:hypothetical protein